MRHLWSTIAVIMRLALITLAGVIPQTCKDCCDHFLSGETDGIRISRQD